MKVRLLIVVLSMSFVARGLSSETVLVASIVVYDKDSAVVEQDVNPSEEIYECLLNYWFEGLVTFRRLSIKEYGEIYTVLDAHRSCAAEDAGYMLFGYMQKNERSWLADVKLYDYKAKKISREFYSGDDISHYNRLLDNLVSNILDGLEEVMGLSRGRTIREKSRICEIRLPLSAFYWTPVDKDWHSRFLGLAGGEIGMEIYPPQPKMVLGKMLLDFSLRPGLSYSCAVGQGGIYPLTYHGMQLALPICAHFHFTAKNSLYMGGGAYYEIEMMHITPKYEDKEFHYQNIFGIETKAGYEFGVSKGVNLFTEIRIDFHLNGDGFIAIKSALGASFSLYREQK